MPYIFFKIFVSLLFIFSFLDAETTQNKNLQNELNTIKLEIEKLKIIHDQTTVFKIIELENSIKDLENKIVESKVDKKAFEKEFEKYNEIINRQDERISSNFTTLEIVVAFFGVLVTVIVIIFSFRNSVIARVEANKELQSWIKENQEKILTPIQNEADKLSSEIQEQIDEFFKDAKERLSEHDIKEELNNRDKELLAKITNSLKNKHEENYTYNDWYTLYLEEYYKNGRAHKLKALEYIDKALSVTNDLTKESDARFKRAYLYGLLDEKKKSIEEYQAIIEEFKDIQILEIQQNVIVSFHNIALEISKSVDGFELAHNYNNEAIELFKNSNDEFLLSQINNIIQNTIELDIMMDYNIEENISLYKNKFFNDERGILIIEMLEILDKAKNENQDKEIIDWKEKYKDVKFINWHFFEIRNWAKTIKDKEAKERIEKYIAIFEEKQQNDSNKK